MNCKRLGGKSLSFSYSLDATKFLQTTTPVPVAYDKKTLFASKSSATSVTAAVSPYLQNQMDKKAWNTHY